jgi:fatty acid amide hydrolase 2
VVLKQLKMTQPARNRKEKTNRTVAVLGVILSVLFKILELVSDAIFSFLHRKVQTEKLPPFKNRILLDSATSLAAKIRNQTVSVNIIISVYISSSHNSYFQVTSEEVVQAYIERIKEVNPLINCMVDNRFDEALKEARNVDKLIQSKQKDAATLELETPFLGVPFSTKDTFAVKGSHFHHKVLKRIPNI